MPHVDQRLRRAWLESDWESLGSEGFRGLPAAVPFACLARLQQGEALSADEVLALVEDADPSLFELTLRLLVAGTHDAIGRCELLTGSVDSAEQSFRRSLQIDLGDGEQSWLHRWRTSIESERLGLPYMAKCWDRPKAASAVTGTELLEQLAEFWPDTAELSLARGEMAFSVGSFGEAVGFFQVGIAKLTMNREYWWARLAAAYGGLTAGFPLGRPDEELLLGSIDKYDLLARCHRSLQPTRYLEIGVQAGVSFRLAQCDAIGVDPMPRIAAPLHDSHRIVSTTSEEYFASLPHDAPRVDFSFIDGMHLFEYALRDFINVEKRSQPWGVIVIDDVLPCHVAQADRRRRTRAWTGDVWKLVEILKIHRPDLSIEVVDAYPTGMAIISNLNPEDDGLAAGLARIVREWMDRAPPPEVIDRAACSPVEDPEEVDRVLSLIKAAGDRIKAAGESA